MVNMRIRGSNSNPKANRKVNHVFAFRNNLGLPCKSREIMPNIAVVLFNADCMLFPDNMAFGRQNLSESLPVISKKETVSAMLHLVVEPLESGCVTLAKNPCYRSPRTAVNSLYEPEFVFFEPI